MKDAILRQTPFLLPQNKGNLKPPQTTFMNNIKHIHKGFSILNLLLPPSPLNLFSFEVNWFCSDCCWQFPIYAHIQLETTWMQFANGITAFFLTRTWGDLISIIYLSYRKSQMTFTYTILKKILIVWSTFIAEQDSDAFSQDLVFILFVHLWLRNSLL